MIAIVPKAFRSSASGGEGHRRSQSSRVPGGLDIDHQMIPRWGIREAFGRGPEVFGAPTRRPAPGCSRRPLTPEAPKRQSGKGKDGACESLRECAGGNGLVFRGSLSVCVNTPREFLRLPCRRCRRSSPSRAAGRRGVGRCEFSVPIGRPSQRRGPGLQQPQACRRRPRSSLPVNWKLQGTRTLALVSGPIVAPASWATV